MNLEISDHSVSDNLYRFCLHASLSTNGCHAPGHPKITCTQVDSRVGGNDGQFSDIMNNAG
jgi:hypothetical protein